MSTTADVKPVKPLDPSQRWTALAIFAIVGAVAIGIFLELAVFKGQTATRTAPDVVFTDHAGKPVHLTDYRGKIVFVNFWATWCPPCVAETPSFDRFAAKVQAKYPNDVAVIAASLDDQEWSVIDPFVKRYGVKSLPIFLDRTERGGGNVEYGAQAAKFTTNKLPETWIVGRDGRILTGRLAGAIDWDREGDSILRDVLNLDHGGQGSS